VSAPVPEKASKPWQSSVNYWFEANGRETYLNLYFYTIQRGNLDIILEDLSVPGNQFQRIRVHYGDFFLCNTKDAVISFRPGIIADTIGDVYVGGRLSASFPRINLTLSHDGYGGNNLDRHESFAEWKPLKNLALMYYRFADKTDIPKSLIGPKVYLDRFYFYYGWPTDTNRRNLIWAGGSFNF
jgi:hypothetical protein